MVWLQGPLEVGGWLLWFVGGFLSSFLFCILGLVFRCRGFMQGSVW